MIYQRVPWKLSVYFPKNTDPVVLTADHKLLDDNISQVIYSSSSFKIVINCEFCNIKAVDFKSSLSLQRLTCTPYEWDTATHKDHTVLTLALMDVDKTVKISDGWISVSVNDIALPFVCEHEKMQYRMRVENKQPAYYREKDKIEAASGMAVRKNKSDLPPFSIAALPSSLNPLTKEDQLLADIGEGIESVNNLLKFFYLPNYSIV